MTGMAGSRPVGTLGDVLAASSRRFVGRVSEIELFQAALESAPPPFSVLHLYRPGNIGKTWLLDIFADLATGAGAGVVRLDGRELSPSPHAVVDALMDVLDRSGGKENRPGQVVLVDAYERLAGLDGWFRTELLSRLPATAVTVIAGRERPAPMWRADPAWASLLRVVSLRNLSPQECYDYLGARGIDPAEHTRLFRITHGHPLGLSLVADVVSGDGDAAADPLTPDLVGTLVRQFAGVVPSGLHRRALEVCALARVSTEGLLRDTLGLGDAGELFAWLRGRSFVDSGPGGLCPHDLARDVLDVDLRWRDPEGYKQVFQVFRSVRAHVHRRLKTARGIEQQRALRCEDGRVRGFVALLDLARASAEDMAADPAAGAAWDFAQRHAPPRPGEAVTLSRFMIDGEVYQQPSPTMNAAPILAIQRYLQTPIWHGISSHWPSQKGGMPTSRLPTCRAPAARTSRWAAAGTGCSPMTSGRCPWTPGWNW